MTTDKQNLVVFFFVNITLNDIMECGSVQGVSPIVYPELGLANVDFFTNPKACIILICWYFCLFQIEIVQNGSQKEWHLSNQDNC